MVILAVTMRPGEIQEFLVELGAATKAEIEVETSGAEALKRIKAEAPRLVVIDDKLPDFEPLKLVTEVMMVSAMTLTAVVTDMSADDFHEASEGYGVLKALPMNPKSGDAKELAGLLEDV